MLLMVLCLYGGMAVAADVSVRINGVSPGGHVSVGLFDGEEGFPRERKPLLSQRIPADGDHVTLVFPNLAAGRYAVVAYHDLDADGELGTNLFGVPTEAYGFSNDARGAIGPPPFEAAAFEVGAENLEIEFNLQ